MISPEQRRQLEILGYTRPESRVRIRCFIAKGMPLDEQLARGAAWQKDDLTIIPTPVDGWLYLDGTFVQLKKKRCGGQVVLDSNGNSIWIENKTYKNGIAYLRAVNTKGYGIYLIPNEGGGADADIIRFPALFYECDQISKDEQRQRLRSLESKLERSASMVVETRNSLHCYFALSYDKLLPSTWRHYQQRLIQQQESDDGIWNPARLMRLVGFDHQKWNQETLKLEQFPVRLAWESDDIFALDDFDKVLPQRDEQRWNPKQQSERVATSPVDNPWDIRNFAYYLNGYKVNGRSGWDTCKCPAHNGESDNSLHINQSTGATKCHSGCNFKDVYHAALELAKSRGYQVPQQRSGYQFSDLGGWLFKLKQQLAKTVERRSNWGFDHKSKVEVEPSPALAAPAIEYQAGEQLAAWSEAVRRKAKYILVNDATGCGKSYHAGMVTPERVEANGIAYVSGEHRNPSTPTLQSWTVLEGRHQGLYRDEFGRLRRADKGQPYVVPPSCGRNGVVDALRNKNIPGADTSVLLCQGTCPDADLCKIGAKFGHLYNRANTLKQSRFISHPSSLPEPSEYDYRDKVVIWDEPGQILQAHRSISVRASDLQRTIADLAVKSPEVFDALRPQLTTIHQFLSGEIKPPNKFGCKDSQIRAAIPKPEDVDIEALSAALMPNPDSLLNHTKEYGVDLADLKRSERKRFCEKDSTTAARIQEELALNWLPDFLTILLGYEVGYLHINHGILTITIPERRLSEIARAAKSNIFLDATATAEDLARVLGIAPSEILTMRQSIPDTSNLEIVQVATMGRLGVGSRRKDKDGEDTLLQKRVDALISQIQQDTPGKLGVIDFKRYTLNGDGKRHWWVDSRGVNDLEDCDGLVMVGTPCRNLSDLEAEFTILYGRPPQEGTERVKYPVQVNGQPSPDLQPWFEMEVSIDLEFRAFVRRRILADIHQCIGRLRAHRRPEKQLKVCFIADYPLDVPVTLKKASHVTPEAATKVERVEMAIRDAVEQLRATKQKITQSAIATITGYSQQYISKFRVLLLLLLDKPYSKSSKNGEPPPDPGEIEFNGQIYLPLLAQESPEEILKGMLAIFEAHGQAAFKAIWSATPAAIQIKILKTLLLILPASELRTLATAVGVKL